MMLIQINQCPKCKCEMALPEALYYAARQSKRIEFYCAYGHLLHFPEGETEEKKLRRERDRLAQRVAERDDEIKRQRDMRKAAERRTAAARGQVTKIKNRVGHGV